MTDLETAQGLRAAAAVIRRCGWTQGDYGFDEGVATCLVGSVVRGIDAFGRAQEEPYLRALSGDAESEFWAIEFTLTEWNDQPERTVDEVLDRLESTALALEVRALAATGRFGGSASGVTTEATNVKAQPSGHGAYAREAGEEPSSAPNRPVAVGV